MHDSDDDDSTGNHYYPMQYHILLVLLLAILVSVFKNALSMTFYKKAQSCNKERVLQTMVLSILGSYIWSWSASTESSLSQDNQYHIVSIR